MLGFKLHRLASVYFEHEAHGRQSAGHCPGIEKTAQYWRTICPATTMSHGTLETLQLVASACRQHLPQLGSSDARQPTSAASLIEVHPNGVSVIPLSCGAAASETSWPAWQAASPRRNTHPSRRRCFIEVPQFPAAGDDVTVTGAGGSL
jgi:hypothetical protein